MLSRFVSLPSIDINLYDSKHDVRCYTLLDNSGEKCVKVDSSGAADQCCIHFWLPHDGSEFQARKYQDVCHRQGTNYNCKHSSPENYTWSRCSVDGTVPDACSLNEGNAQRKFPLKDCKWRSGLLNFS